MDTFGDQPTANTPNANSGDELRPVEDRLREALIPFLNSATDPSLDGKLPQTAQPVHVTPIPQHHNHGLPLRIPTLEDVRARIVNREQLAAYAPAHNHYRTAPYPPPVNGTIKPPHQEITPAAAGTHFLRSLPAFDYVLPEGEPLLFTMTEIIVILPNWFRNRDIMCRIHNNGITSAVHYAILEEHRDLNFEAVRARDRLSDTYRKTMRTVDKEWKKAAHRAPDGWNSESMLVNSFLPDAARSPGYRAPAPVPFKTLADGLKKLPQGNDAADLTRALDFAMNNDKPGSMGQGSDFMFPNDIHMILEHIGRTQVTMAHTDPEIIRHYGDILRKAAAEKTQKAAEERRKKDAAERKLLPLAPQQGLIQGLEYGRMPQFQYMPSNGPPPLPSNAHNFGVWDQPHQAAPQTGMNIGYPPLPQDNRNQQDHFDMSSILLNRQQVAGDNVTGAPPSVQPPRSIGQEALAEIAAQLGQELAAQADAEKQKSDLLAMYPIPDVCRMPDLEQDGQEEVADSTERVMTLEQMDALIAQHQDNDYLGLFTPSPSPETDQAIDSALLALDAAQKATSTYPPSHLLRECVEADDQSDQSELARAARWARTSPVADPNWTVADLKFVLWAMEFT